MKRYERYTELEVWKQARFLATYVYAVTSSYPKAEQFGIISQIRRCAISIPSNIAEACGRQHYKEMIRFLSISRGSLYELETQLYISKDLQMISDSDLKDCLNKVESVGKLLNGFIRYFNSKTKVED